MLLLIAIFKAIAMTTTFAAGGVGGSGHMKTSVEMKTSVGDRAGGSGQQRLPL